MTERPFMASELEAMADLISGSPEHVTIRHFQEAASMLRQCARTPVASSNGGELSETPVSVSASACCNPVAPKGGDSGQSTTIVPSSHPSVTHLTAPDVLSDELHRVLMKVGVQMDVHGNKRTLTSYERSAIIAVVVPLFDGRLSKMEKPETCESSHQ